ncbi:MAG: phenylalanine--tRNA ligase subunit alpha [Candidatus Dojkabacteria bacterium]|nr:phenylalanine--tRNA ligase subunit alpha [Candidatus Dojkabacteria bacterium]
MPKSHSSKRAGKNDRKPSISALVRDIKKQLLSDLQSDPPISTAQLKTKYLGKQGMVTRAMKEIGAVAPEKRSEAGKELNTLKLWAEGQMSRVSETEKMRLDSGIASDDGFDVTAPFPPNTTGSERPGLEPKVGTLHPLTTVGEKAIRIFESMGFHLVEARRLDDDYNSFEALNIPKGHPARDLWDTFWTEDRLIPIPHTSAMQNRILSSVKPPIREIIVGKCFRNEATDASHEHTFYQLEGVYVDKNVTLTDLIGTLSHFMNAFYGRDIKYKIQPSYFPFVEPGLEFLIECLVCGQRGCPFCHYSKWVEVIPCGPIHPNVLRESGLNPDEYSGFAWGLGFDRLVILRNQISDIRLLHSGDLKFLEQFR